MLIGLTEQETNSQLQQLREFDLFSEVETEVSLRSPTKEGILAYTEKYRSVNCFIIKHYLMYHLFIYIYFVREK